MAAAAVLPVLGGATGALSAIAGGNSKASAADYNASIANTNAALAIQQSEEDARIQNSQSEQTIGSARANYGASGVSSASGSASDVLQWSAANAALDRAKILQAGKLKAWGYQTGAALDSASAANDRASAGFGVASTIFNTGSTLAKGGYI